MRPNRRRSVIAGVLELEPRTLLTGQGPTAVWIGQDGHDLVSQSSTPGPNDVQDMHFTVSGLPADRTVTTVQITGYGGGMWLYQGRWGPAAAAWIQAAGATTADVYLDPYMIETGREFDFTVSFDDGSSAFFNVQGGAADPNLRMPSAVASARWAGQDGRDLTGAGPDVGPDGIQDSVIALAGLSAGIAISSVDVSSGDGLAWSYGMNPSMFWNAELQRSADGRTADLFINPVPGLEGRTLTVVISYANGKTDVTSVVAGASDPNLHVPTPSPVAFSWSTLAAGWIGQDGLDLTGPGDVHVSVSGLPAGRTVVSAMLSDPSRYNWIYQANGAPATSVDPSAYPLAFRRTNDRATGADITFTPARDEAGSTLTLSLTLDDGSVIATRFAGGSADLSRRAPAIAPTSITAHPGDDVAVLVTQFGSVHLSAGTYNLSQPLMLPKPVAITADPGATLLFAQGAADAPWTTAINVECGNTTLDGFAVRFAGPIRWTTGVNSGPSVIGNSNAIDGGPKTPLVNITLSHLDLVSPPPSSDWEEAAHLIWMGNALSGTITDNTLKGGTTEFFYGPWQVTGNRYLGTVPNTFAYSVISAHYTHDTVIANNTIEPAGPSGKTWRFLVLTGGGYNDVISDNTVVGVGPMDNDTVPNPNAPEVILTESYRLQFEGAPAAIDAGGWVVQIPAPQGFPGRTGDVVSILSGSSAGQYRLIAQALSPTVYLLDAPLPSDATVISISTGFVNETFARNTIDSRGSSVADGMVLAGNHFGTQVIDNHFLGGNLGLRISAMPTEFPNIWGWSHVPFLGATFEGNILEDTLRGGAFTVDHSSFIKTESGRTYMTIALRNNTVVWSDAFLAAYAERGTTGLPPTFTIGDLTTANPVGLWITAEGNSVRAPAIATAEATWQVNAAMVNGQAVINTSFPLAPVIVLTAPAGFGLVNDTGSSASDGITKDGRLEFDPVPSAAGYEYSTSGNEGTFQSLGSATSFLPGTLAQGTNTLYVRAFDDQGRRGPSANFTFTYDTVAPGAVPGLTAFRDGHVEFQSTGPGDVYEYRLGGSKNYVAIGSSTRFSDPKLLKGNRTVQVHAIDLAGNVGIDSLTNIVPTWMPVAIAPTPNPVPVAPTPKPAPVIVAPNPKPAPPPVAPTPKPATAVPPRPAVPVAHPTVKAAPRGPASFGSPSRVFAQLRAQVLKATALRSAQRARAFLSVPGIKHTNQLRRWFVPKKIGPGLTALRARIGR